MDYKLNLITPSLYSNSGKANCFDELVEKFAHHLKKRSDIDFNLKCKYNPIPGLAFIHKFEDFEERFLIHSEYAVIIASPSSQAALNKFMPRLLVFLTAKPLWQNRFLFVILGKVNVLSNLVANDPIEFSMDNWEDHDEESWIKLFDLIKIKWEPHVDKCDSENILKETSLADSINEQNNSTKESQNLLKNEISSGNHIISNTTLTTLGFDHKTTTSSSIFNTESQTKIDESVNSASDLHGKVENTGNHSFQKDTEIDNSWKEESQQKNTENMLNKINIINISDEKSKLTINVKEFGESNLIDEFNTLNTNHEKNVKENNLNADCSQDNSLSNEINNNMNINNKDNNSLLLSETKLDENVQTEDHIVMKEEPIRIIKCASRKLQGSSVTLENMLYFQPDEPINNETKIYENREMNTDESIFKNKNNTSNEKELPPIFENIKEHINESPQISNQSSYTDSEQIFECHLDDQIYEEQENEYEIPKEIVRKTSREFNFQSFEYEEEKEALEGKNDKNTSVENEEVEKMIHSINYDKNGMIDGAIIVDNDKNFGDTMKREHSNLDHVLPENHENIERKQFQTGKEYLNSDDSKDYENKLVEIINEKNFIAEPNDSNFTVSNQFDKNSSIKTKDENNVRMNTDVDNMFSGIGFGSTNEVSINRSGLNRDDDKLKMSSNDKTVTLLELEFDNKSDTSIDHKTITQVNLDSSVAADSNVDFNNHNREVSDNLHLCNVGNLISDESSNFINNNTAIDSIIDTDVKSISNIGKSVNADTINPNLDESRNSIYNNQGFKNIGNIGDEIKPSGELSQRNVNKEFTDTNKNIDKISLNENNAGIDKMFTEKIDLLGSDDSQFLTKSNNFDTKLKNNETTNSLLEIALEHRDLDNKEISIKTDNQILVENKFINEIINNENKAEDETESKETEFVSPMTPDVENSILEEQRKEFEKSDYNNDIRLVIDTSNIDDTSDIYDTLGYLDMKQAFDEKPIIKQIYKNEIFSQNIKYSEDSYINKEIIMPFEDLSVSSEPDNMNIGSRIHFTSDDIDIDISRKKSELLKYEKIEEENKEEMEEESYIRLDGENQGNDYNTMDDFQGDQSRSQIINRTQFSMEISHPNNNNNIDLDLVLERHDNSMDDQNNTESTYEYNDNENKEESKDSCSITHENRISMNTEYQLKNSYLYDELNRQEIIENGSELEIDVRNSGNRSHYTIFQIPLNCLNGLRRFPTFLWTVIFANQSHISHVDNEQSSNDTENSLTRCLHSPWCVLLLFVTGTLASPYWVEITRNISLNAVGANLIDKISSTVLHEDSVNRKYAILPLENH